jgi:polysaccharide biosynthesis protein PslH
MRILFLSPRQCWPPLSGAKLRDYHLARSLGQQAEVTYLHFTDPGSPPLTRSDLPFCSEVIAVPKPRAYSPASIAKGLAGRWPLPVLNYTSKEMFAALRGVTLHRRYDLVHLDSIHMAGYEDAITRDLDATPRFVYNWHNIESALMRRYSKGISSLPRRVYATWTASRLEQLERRILETAFGHIVCSETERESLQQISPQARIAVIDNGVDTKYFAGAAGSGPRNRIVFVGKMDYHPNVDAAVFFARQVWPAVRKRLPGCGLILAGANPGPAVLALREIEGVEVTGTVPDVRPYYRDAIAAVVPLRSGGGTRLKILEAMAAGVPVVSTEIGAEGLAVTPGSDIVFADSGDTEAWVRELAALAESEPRRDELAAAGLELVRRRYDWEILGKSLYETYRLWLEQAG